MISMFGKIFGRINAIQGRLSEFVAAELMRQTLHCLAPVSVWKQDSHRLCPRPCSDSHCSRQTAWHNGFFRMPNYLVTSALVKT